MIDAELVLLTASRSPLAVEVARRIEAADAVGRSALVALSGGADSTALLILALALTRRRKPAILGDITIGHVDHALRRESEAEAETLKDLAATFGVPYRVRRLDWSGRERISAAETRDARWAALAELASEAGAAVVLAGHHADDQAETILLRMSRGVGVAGLGGIREVRPLDDSIRIVRPLLGVRRRSLVDLLRDAGLDWFEDPSNRRGDRGRIRHEVLPVLESLHAGVAARIAATAEEIRGFAPDRPASGTGVSPEAVRWSRTAMSVGDRADVAGRVRAAVAAIPGIDRIKLEATPRSCWDSVARTIMGNGREPRYFAVPGVGEVVVTSDAVELRCDRVPEGGETVS